MQGAVVGAVAGVGGGVLGALVGAFGAVIVAQYNREEAREARFASRLRELSLQLMEDALSVGLELTQEVAARAATGQAIDTSGMPKVRDIVAIRRRLLELDFTARSEAVSVAGQELVGCMEKLRDDFVYLVPRDMEIGVQPRRQVLATPLPSSVRDDLKQRLSEMERPIRGFQNAVRKDLGLHPLAEFDGPASTTKPGQGE